MMIPVARAILPFLPTPAGYWLTRQLASLISSPGLRPGDRQFFDQATRVRFGRDLQNCGCLNGSGPMVLLVHGWAGRGAQMIPLANSLLECGFRVGIPDMTAHGESKGRRATFRDFIHDIRAFCDAVGESPFAIVGHSAGGLAAAAARLSSSLRAKRYVFVNAPRAPYVPIDEIERLLQPRPAILDRCRDDYARQFDSDWHALERGDAYACDDATAALLVYDDGDSRVQRDDAELIGRRWRGAIHFRTSGLGHMRPLRDESAIRRITEFLRDDPAHA
jgi:pimeloyl-ACP methyl ester carboxylesterase